MPLYPNAALLTAKPRLPLKEVLLFGFWPSFIKRWIYRLRGYRIGKGVTFGFGTVLCGRDIEIGDYTSISFLTIIRGTTVRIGSHVQIGATTFLDIAHLEIGDGTKINEQVFVGGLQFPDSRFVVGRNCQIMQMTFINPAREIRIGDDTGIGGDCLLFGHSSWLSAFEGYPVEFDSIEIGNSVSLAWRVFVLPGTKIGDGAVIGANSLARGVIPGRCLAVGFPARPVSRPNEFPREVTDEQKVRILKDLVAELMLQFGDSGFLTRQHNDDLEVIIPARRWFSRPRTRRLRMLYEPVTDGTMAALPRDLDVLLSLRKIPAGFRDVLERRGTMWLDIEKKERPQNGNDVGEEVYQYLKRYGVRLNRV